MKRFAKTICGLCLSLGFLIAFGQPNHDSGGTLLPEQAAYDVTFYDLTLAINPGNKTISGNIVIHANVLAPIKEFMVDLDDKLKVGMVRQIHEDRMDTLFSKHKDGRLKIFLTEKKQFGESLVVRIDYGGKPLAAEIIPGSWSDGFHWTTTESGEPWIGVVSVLNGADIWWPCKDHPSDEADSMALHITVPESLFVAANGRLRQVEMLENGNRTFDWFISTPINNYAVSLNIAPYKTLTTTYESISGDTIPVSFWVLPEHEMQAKRTFPQLTEHLQFYENLLGPYPFRADKYGVAETPFFGMEHQTIIAYGNDFTNNEYGFDLLHFHELAHEWWANMVTAADWKDWWLHEGFATYMEALYVEELENTQSYHRYMMEMKSSIHNHYPVAPMISQSTRDIYSGEIYVKGAWILHTLRYLIGKEALFQSLRLMAYPEAEMETISNGDQCRFVTSDDFQAIVEEVLGQSLDWFFDLYLRQPKLPTLRVLEVGGQLLLEWETPSDLPFPMPLDLVWEDGTIQRIEMKEGRAEIDLNGGSAPLIDPQGWILKN